MDNGYTNGFGTQDILTGRGLGLYGFGGYGDLSCGNSSLAALTHADGTALGAKIDCNSGSLEAALNRISDQNEETRRIIQSDELKALIFNGQLNSAILDGQQNVAMADRLNDIKSEAAKCCCDTQKLIIEENSKTREFINAQALKTAEREIDVLRGQANTQEILRAICCGCGNGGFTHPGQTSL